MTGSEDFLSGIPIAVDPERIDRELSRFWKPEGSGAAEGPGAVTRTCLANLVFHVAGARARARVSELITDIGRRFPSRLIVLTHGEPSPASERALAAWITAVCHRPKPGAAPVCCEQITLETRSTDVETFRGTVMPLLVPDVPVILVLLEGGDERLAGILGGITDRIVLDSRAMGPGALELLATRIERDCRVVDDLAWHSVLPWRRLLADLFDETPVRDSGDSLASVEVLYSGGEPSVAAEEPGTVGHIPSALLAGWLVSRLGWQACGASDDASGLAAAFRRGHQRVRCVLRPSHRSPSRGPGTILEIRWTSREGCGVRVSLEDGAVFRVHSSEGMGCVLPRTVSYRQASDGDLLAAALQRVTHQGVLGAAIRAAITFQARHRS